MAAAPVDAMMAMDIFPQLKHQTSMEAGWQ